MSASTEGEQVELQEAAARGGSQSSCGVIPSQATNPATTSRLIPKVIAAVSVAAVGMMHAREAEPPKQRLAVDERDHPLIRVPSAKNDQSTIPMSSARP